jgi:hypothetical protein
MLLKPKLRGLKRAAILSQLTLMTILLKRVAQFIIKVTLTVRKERIKNPYGFIIIRGPKVPKFIMNLVQRKLIGHETIAFYCIYLLNNPKEIFSLKPSQTRKCYLFHPLTNFFNTTTRGESIPSQILSAWKRQSIASRLNSSIASSFKVNYLIIFIFLKSRC